MGFETVIFVMIVVWLLVSVMVASHASEQGKTGLWGLVVLIFGIFGLVGYAISLASD